MAHAPGFIKISEESRGKIRELTVAQVAEKFKRGDQFTFIDVREDDEWRAGYARGAIHLGRGVLERDIEERIPDTGAELVLYCGGGYRSAMAADSLQQMGYRNVYSMDGGIKAWRSAGLPEEKPA